MKAARMDRGEGELPKLCVSDRRSAAAEDRDKPPHRRYAGKETNG